MLFVGRLIAEKGADQFVAACTTALASLPGWRAEIIGGAEHMVKSPETPFVRMLQATAEPAGISMMGYRDHPDVMAAMARAAIVVIPSRAPEPSGRMALEAMANGAAVICFPRRRDGGNRRRGGGRSPNPPNSPTRSVRWAPIQAARRVGGSRAVNARRSSICRRSAAMVDALRARIIADGASKR